jgi:type I restriction enzyme S subunit
MKVGAAWAEVALLDVCTINPARPAISPTATIDYVRFSGLDDVLGKITATSERPVQEVPRGASVFRQGDVLFAAVTAEQWLSVLVGELPNGLGMSAQLSVLRPTPELSARYLWHFLQQPWLRQKATAMNTSTHSQPIIARSFFRELRIELPSIEEQRYIVDCLDQADASPYREAQRRVTHLKETLAERLMLPSDEAPKPGWSYLRMEDICRINPRDDEPAAKTISAEDAVIFLSHRDLLSKKTGNSVMPYGQMPNPARQVRAADLLYGAEPATATYGHVLEVPQASAPTFAARTMTVLSPNDSVSSPYLAALLRSRWFNHPQASHGVSAVRGQSTTTRLKRRKLPLPPLAEQKRILSILDAVPDAQIAQALLKSRVMYHALAKDAFNGKLTRHGFAPSSDPVISSTVADAITEAVEPSPNRRVPFKRSHRRNVTSSLSTLQRLVWRAMRMRKHVLIVDDPESFDSFCESASLKPFSTYVSPNQIRRTLEQIAAIGLIHKMNLPPRDKDDRLAYLEAFRRYQEGEDGRITEDTAVSDASALLGLIKKAEEESVNAPALSEY